MTEQGSQSTIFNVMLWIVQILLATYLLMAAKLHFSPINEISGMMPWTAQTPLLIVRLLGVIDLLGAMGMILPALLRVKPKLTPIAAICCIGLMISAIIFHVTRGETSVIGGNVVAVFLSAFVAWGGLYKVPIASR